MHISIVYFVVTKLLITQSCISLYLNEFKIISTVVINILMIFSRIKRQNVVFI